MATRSRGCCAGSTRTPSWSTPPPGAAAFVLSQLLPVLHVWVEQLTLRAFADGPWQDVEVGDEPETVRNVLAIGLIAGGAT